MNSPVKRCLLPKPIRPAKPSCSPSINNISIRPQQRRIEPKAPTQLHISTPQSNFLNAVNLRPANTANPAAFSAQLLNKNIIIPNAFYGNPPEVRGQPKAKTNKNALGSNKVVVGSNTTAQQEQIYRRWLDNFLINFASPLQIASHACFVLLQRVLKNKFLIKVKEARTHLNTMAQRQQTNATPASLDLQLMFDLRNTLYGSDAKLSPAGIRFCEFASKQTFGKQVPLTTDVKTGRVTSRMLLEEEVPQEIATKNGLTKPNVSHTPNGCSKKRQKPDLDEYTPDKPVVIAAAEPGSGQEERKRSLRTNRSKRIDHNFSYNEDQNDFDDEDDEIDDSEAAIRRKIEQKRQEAQQQRQRMAKSFESAFIEAFGKRNDGPEMKRPKICSTMGNSFEAQPDFALSTLPPRNGDQDEVDSFDEGPKEHRIYKVTPTALIKAPIMRPKKRELNVAAFLAPEIITCSDGSEDSDDGKSKQTNVPAAPKNTNRLMHMMAKDHDLCVICNRRAQRIVHHYVNEHRGCEVYTSRLTQAQVKRLMRNQQNTAQISPYRNGQNQYEATCAFCQKRSRFMLSYWHQHFSMHTGEYAYRCGGCGVRKPTRSLMHAHINTPCKKRGTVRQDFTFDGKSSQIEARICTICNYIQLHRSNIVQHLRIQHNVREILPKYIRSVVLLKIPAITSTETFKTETTTIAMDEMDSASSGSNLGTSANDSNNAYFDYYDVDSADVDSAAQFNYEEGDPSDDLSFMICGMLDVQMNTD